MGEQLTRTSVRVEGIVQGVGFRPFVYSLATGLGLRGFVGNDSDGVFAEVEGPVADISRFLLGLERDPPPLARIERVTATAMPPGGPAGFVIVASRAGGPRRTLISADSATCADCLRELADPADRRFGYPFINCTNCGPRYTIVRDVPYDRPFTTMAPFAMCEQCAAEYHDPGNRRFHAQPICCPACGPRLTLVPAGAGDISAAGEAVRAAAALLLAGRVLAVKGLGGYHLAVDATSERAAATLRARKQREDKPFAVLVADLAQARELAEVDAAAAGLLTSAARPIVLLPRRADAAIATGTGGGAVAGGGAIAGGAAGLAIAASVAPGSRQLGVMLPYTPLHHLLVAAVGRPVVLTSGNRSDEPIAYRDQDALARLGEIADGFLRHDRAIHIRTDDSVAVLVRGKPALQRRSRGYVPEPITVHPGFARPVLACGAELKNTFCLGKGKHAVMSQHIGDLENAETLASYREGIAHLRRLFDIEPVLVAHDLHPDYLSTRYALDLPDVDLIAVQHHHAHIASCLADNGTGGPVIGVAFDGTGYGSDGTIWGGEFLIADLVSFERAGHLAPVPMPGGAAAIRAPWRMAAAYLDGYPHQLDVARRNERHWSLVQDMARKNINSPLTSSAGRLFDAVAALLGVRDTVSYEGQAAIELEQLAAPGVLDGYRAGLEQHRLFWIKGGDLVLAAAEQSAAGERREVIAARFHHGVAAAIEAGCVLARERTGLGTVALSGGVFQNSLLVHATVRRLEAAGFLVLTHARVPCNDGGISLGQAVIAGALADPGQRVAD